MPYDEGGETPMVGDRVRHTRYRSEKTGTVYNVQLSGGNTPGYDQVSVKWDDGPSAVHLADECRLISRAQSALK
jgi:hypothetical protein